MAKKPNRNPTRIMPEKRACPECARKDKIITRLTQSADGESRKRLYLNEKQLAARWNVSLKFLQKMREAGTGPKVTRFGRSVRYRLRYIVAFERRFSSDNSE